MLDPKILRKDTAKVIQNLKRRGYVFDESLWNELEEKRKKLQGFTEEQQAELNDLSKAIGIGKKNSEDTSDIQNQATKLTTKIKELSAELESLLEEIDNFVATQAEIDAIVSNIPTPKAKQSNLIPMVLLLMHTINGIITNCPLVALCDSGSSHCMFNKRALPFEATTFKTQKIKTTTTQGTYDCDKAVVLSNLSLPKFVNGRKITNLSAQVFNSENCPYDVILGRDFMDSIGLDIQFSTGSIKWLDTIVDMKHVSMYDHIKKDITDIGIQASNRDAMLAWRSYQEDILFDDFDIDQFDSILDDFEEFNECYATTEIKARKYQAVSTDEVVAQLDHLTGGQKQLLKRVLDKHTILFDGKLGCYTGEKVHLELIDNFTPSWKRAYPVPFTKEKYLKMN